MCLGKQQKMAEVLWPLAAYQGNKMEFLIAGFGVTQHQPSGEWASGWKISFLSFSLSLSATVPLKQINK